jgi:hypothetical protein
MTYDDETIICYVHVTVSGFNLHILCIFITYCIDKLFGMQAQVISWKEKTYITRDLYFEKLYLYEWINKNENTPW